MIISKNKCIGVLWLVSFVVSGYLIVGSNASSGEILETYQVVQDVNGIGVTFEDDISSYMDSSTKINIFIALNDNYALNGLYKAGFDWTEASNVIYKLGSPFDVRTPWFESSTSLILNYGSIIYIDILDYLVAFGTADDIKALVILSPYSFTDMKLQADSVTMEFQSYLIATKPTTTVTSSNNPSIIVSSTDSCSFETTTQASTNNEPNMNNTSSKTSITSISKTLTSKNNSTSSLSTAVGFEGPLIISLFGLSLLVRKNKKIL